MNETAESKPSIKQDLVLPNNDQPTGESEPIWCAIKQENEGEADKPDPLAEDINKETPSEEFNSSNSDIMDQVNSSASSSLASRAPNRRSNAPTVRKRPRTSTPNTPGAPTNKRHRKGRRRVYDSDSDDSKSLFLDIERRKLESAERLSNALSGISREMGRMVRTLHEIRDIILVSIVARH